MAYATTALLAIGVLTWCSGFRAPTLMGATPDSCASETDVLTIRGHQQTVHLYGTRGHPPVIVSSGDGGWIHLGPHVAERLAASGYFVVGFDAKAYLRSFTSGASTLKPEDEPGDYAVLAEYAGRGSTQKPILAGVSEGAGLSVLAATDPGTKSLIGGVLAIGLPDINELGWRWQDSVIYLTHGVPNEPTFNVETIVEKISPAPLAAIHSTRDAFAPLVSVEQAMTLARQPKRLWIVPAADHGFSDNLAGLDQRLLEAVRWLRTQQPG